MNAQNKSIIALTTIAALLNWCLPTGSSAAIGSGAAEAPSGPASELILHVVDRTGTAVKGADVVIHSGGQVFHRRTGSDGVTLALPMGTAHIVAHKAGVGRNHAQAGVSMSRATEFVLTLEPRVGYAGGFHRVLWRRSAAVREAEARHRLKEHDEHAGAESRRENKEDKKADEPVDTTPNHALTQLPGTRHRARRGNGDAAEPAGVSGIGAGGINAAGGGGTKGGGAVPAAPKAIAKPTFKHQQAPQ